MKQLKIHTKRGVLLDGALFSSLQKSDTVMIAITGIHGNFYSNPFYYNIGNTLSAAGIDFVYAQTNDAFGAIRTQNTVTTVPTDTAEVKIIKADFLCRILCRHAV
ncbi:MAG: hypothetical protein IJ150_12365 [Bacteroidales bacterium]|nr:hypothetical protein [Bacteroidales bacterium]